MSSVAEPVGSGVTLIVPGRNAARTLRACLEASAELVRTGELSEIVFVDDGSTDESAMIAEEIGARCLQAGGKGPGAARNVGWRSSSTDLVWFIDADCVPHADALDILLGSMSDPAVGGVGGSYSNAVPQSLLARIIHAEIRVRHLAMGSEVDYLGSFNVLYRRFILEDVDGYDEEWVNGPGAPGGEDADLSYRIAALGHHLRFRTDALVAHHHPVGLGSYLRAQRLHGFWGVRLYRRHPRRGRRNSYSDGLDHVQPLLALGCLLSLPFLASGRALPAVSLFVLLVLSTLPMAFRLASRRGSEMLAFVPLAVIRAFARGIGLGWGLLDMMTPGQWKPRR